MKQDELAAGAETGMKDAIKALRKSFGAIRTGRASLTLFEGIMVDYYGSSTPLNQVGTLSVPDARQVVIQPWDQKSIPDIEKAIMKSDLGLTPANDGKLIRIPIPQLTEERRAQLVKVVKKKSEEGKVEVRNIRREVNEAVKKREKEESLSEDDTRKTLDKIQKLTDNYIKEVDKVLEDKEKEIMEV